MRFDLLRPVGAGLFVLVFAGVGTASGEARADDAAMVVDLGSIAIETRKVSHGVFTQGAVTGEPGHDKDEEPQRQVTITKDFWIGKYPVTRGQFARFVADTRYVSDAEKGQAGGSGWDGKQLTQKKDATWRNPGFTQTDEHPVVLVTYGDANAFVGWISRKSGKRVRLPTEAEWELAARGGTTTPWYGGSTEAEALTLGWFKGNAGNGTRPVGQKTPNALGIFDMSGNVFEWCRDVYAPYRGGAVVDPEATANGAEAERRVLRGGSWVRDPKRGRSAARGRNAPGARTAENGFRVVITDDEVALRSLSASATDFAPAAPLGAPGGSVTNAGMPPSAPPFGAASDGARFVPVVEGSEGFSWWLLIVSPLAAASAVVGWMLLRRKRPAGTSVASATARLPATRSTAPMAASADAPLLVPSPVVVPPPVVVEAFVVVEALVEPEALVEVATTPVEPAIPEAPSSEPRSLAPPEPAAPSAPTEPPIAEPAADAAVRVEPAAVDAPAAAAIDSPSAVDSVPAPEGEPDVPRAARATHEQPEG
jgi:formylglycine-generating enzyme required for sulfatase activity